MRAWRSPLLLPIACLAFVACGNTPADPATTDSGSVTDASDATVDANPVEASADAPTDAPTDGLSDVALDADASVAPLALTSVNPINGPNYGGTPLTITGTGFVAGTTVEIDGKACTSTIVASATSIQCVSPSSTKLGKVDVVVRNPTQESAQGKLYSYYRGDLLLGARIHAVSAVAVVAADIDGDGASDLIAAGGSTNTISVMRNLGHGEFAQPVSSAVAGTPKALATGDFNGDAKVDVAVASSTGSSVNVLLNAGNGTLGNAVGYNVGPSVASIATGDVTGDGVADIVAVNTGSVSRVSVLKANGNGTFAAPLTYDLNTTLNTVRLADVSGDGKLDLVLLADATKSVGVMVNSGTGTFSPATGNPTSAQPVDVVVADFAGDSRLDILAATGFTVTLFTNTGSGFVPSTAVNATCAGLLAGDWNNDTKADFVCRQPNLASLYLNNAGTFSTSSDYAVGDLWGTAGSVGDIDGDAVPDVLTASADGVSVLRGLNGTLAGGTNTAVGPMPWGAASADVNGDGFGDVVVSNAVGSATLSVLLGNASGRFSSSTSYPTGGAGRHVALADFDGDGKLDIAHTNYSNSTLDILKNLGGGTFGPPTTLPAGAFTWAVAAADFSGDGKPDLVTTDFGSPYQIVVFINAGNGTLGAPTPIPMGSAFIKAVVTGDFDGDSHIDIFADGRVILNANNGGGFLAPVNVGITGAPIARDFDGDGKTDLVVANGSQVIYYRSTGGGVFQIDQSLFAGPSADGFALCDLNGDGYDDVVLGRQTNGNGISVGINRGGSFEMKLFAVGTNPLFPVCVDMDADGKQDVVSSNNLGNNVTLLHNWSK